MLTSVELTFRIFIGIADPVPRKTTSGYWLLVAMEKTCREPALRLSPDPLEGVMFRPEGAESRAIPQAQVSWW